MFFQNIERECFVTETLPYSSPHSDWVNFSCCKFRFLKTFKRISKINYPASKEEKQKKALMAKELILLVFLKRWSIWRTLVNPHHLSPLRFCSLAHAFLIPLQLLCALQWQRSVSGSAGMEAPSYFSDAGYLVWCICNTLISETLFTVSPRAASTFGWQTMIFPKCLLAICSMCLPQSFSLPQGSFRIHAILNTPTKCTILIG